ncbi:hypothetical protein V7S43_016626 [Phytophthora oleae]|uniref:Uncharacterized protein n=1 Tax=Phytophthora oleae TaxID=2107226 RepID=A0ABD3EZ89_9STRA
MTSETPKKRSSSKAPVSTKAPATKKPRASFYERVRDFGEASLAKLEPNAGRTPTIEAPRIKAPAIDGLSTAEQNVGLSRHTKKPPGEVTEIAEPRKEAVPHLPETSVPSTPVTCYLSPLERHQQMRQAQGSAHEVIPTVEDLHNFIKANDVSLPSVRARLEVKGKVEWTSSHNVKTGELARIHFVDLEAPESLEEMQKCFQDVYDSDYLAIDQLLITAAIFGCTAATPGIPPGGVIVTITNPTKVKLFMD